MAQIAGMAALAAATGATTAAGTAAVALPWLSTAGSLASIASAGGTAGAIAGAGLSAGSILSTLGTGLSLASMASDIFGGAAAGSAAADQLKQQAQQDMLDAKQTQIQGEQQQNDINQSLLQTIASQRLAFSGAGIDFSFGTPANLEQSLRDNADRQLSTSRDNTMLNVLARRRAGYLSLSQVAQAQNTPIIKGVSSAAKTLGGMFDSGKKLTVSYA